MKSRALPNYGWVDSDLTQVHNTGRVWFKAVRAAFPDLDFSEAVYRGKKHLVDGVQCKLHTHHRYSAYPDNIATGKGCIYCTGYRTHVQDYVDRATKVHPDCTYASVLALGEKFSQQSDITVHCKKHGPFVTGAWRHLQDKGGGCPACARNALFLTPEEFAERAQLAHSDPVSGKPYYDYSVSDYVDYYTEVAVRCPVHGVFYVIPDYHIHGTQCPECAMQGSRMERELRERLKAALPKVQWEFNNRRVLPGNLEIDAYAPKEKLGIEAHGLVWHSEYGRPDDASSYHATKLKAAQKVGINLLQFWEHEIVGKPELVLSMVRNRVGLSKTVGARECDVVELSPQESRSFLSAHHLQGSVGSTLRLGLWHRKKNRVAALMTFSPPRLDNDVEWELVRYCSHKDLSVVGGASKLLAHFKKVYAPNSIVSYADRRYSSGELYTKLGFTLTHITKPDYFYVKGNGYRVSRYKARHRELKSWLPVYDPDLSERDNMRANKFFRVYDCGRLVFKWYLKP